MTEWPVRASARRPHLVLVIWLLLGLIAGGLAVDGEMGPGPQLVDVLDRATTTELRLGGGAESRKADMLLEARLRGPRHLREVVIVQSDSLDLDHPDFRAKVERVYAGI